MRPIQWITRRRGAMAVGVVLSAAAGGMLPTGLLDGLNNLGLDLHFRFLGGIPADPRVVLIDIDDSSLASLPQWPWPRRLYADLVGALQELEAGSIALDVIFDQPMDPRVEHANLSRHYDLDTGLAVLGDPASDPPIYDDDELATAIRRGRVQLSMFAKLGNPAVEPNSIMDRAIEFCVKNPGADFSAFQSAVGGVAASSMDRVFIQAQLAAQLKAEFGLDETALAKTLSSPTENAARAVRENLAAAKRIAARRAAHRYLDKEPDGSLPQFLDTILLADAAEVVNADRECLIDAFREERTRRYLASRFVLVPAQLEGRLLRAFDPVYPLDKFAMVAAGIGFVAVGRDGRDGVVRSAPMAVELDGSLVLQLGMHAALAATGGDHSALDYRDGRLLVATDIGRRAVPLDANGKTLINWHVPERSGDHVDWRDSFIHIPAARVLEIPLSRRAMTDNLRRLALARAELVEFRHADTRNEFTRYAGLLRRRDELSILLTHAPVLTAAGPLRSELQLVARQMAAMEEEAIQWLQRAEALWRNEVPRDESETAERARILRLHEWFANGKLAAQIAVANARLEAHAAQLRSELAPRLKGSICLVGYTASGVADLITTPIHTQAPGIMAHANIVNMVLQNRFMSSAPASWNVVLIMAAALAATLAACAGGWRFSLIGLFLAACMFILIGAILFNWGSVHAASLPAVVAAAGVWGGVTLFRQATEERARRRLQRALTQYTSPAIAANIAERYDRAALEPKSATVTCFFSDLRGFTTLSERLGPQRTRRLLNPYLELISRVLLEQGAMVNKFVGDGVFAFFNAPIRPCADHARAGCKAALNAMKALQELNRTHAADLGGATLAMRIGLSTGDAYVGDYGSEMKLDYTCIGDTVNLGSRLEQANKGLGTSILVDDATRRAAGDGFAFRPIGRIAVAGRTALADVHELVDEARNADERVRSFCELLARAIGHYQACEWDLCLAALAQCRSARPQDRTVELYLAAAQSLRNQERGSEWNGTLRVPPPDAGIA